MKKTAFYSMVRENGKNIAKQQNGYTDGQYNYYKNQYGVWHAIHPENGLSICTDTTRKAAAARAATYADNIAEAIARNGERLRDTFEKAKAAAEAA